MCDTVVRVEEDRVLFAKNSDRDPNEAQVLTWHPRADHPPGRLLACTHRSIPQARTTYAVLLSRPFWMWGAEMGTNEHGLTIGNEAVFTKDPVPEEGLTGMDLVRLALERCRDRHEAAQTIGELIDAHGQGGRCGLEDPGFRYHSSFLIADPEGALVLETAGTARALGTVQPGQTRAISNQLTLPGLAETYARRLHGRVAQAAGRRACAERLARQAQGPGDMMALLRDHGPGRTQPAYRWVNGAMGGPCMHAGGLVAASQTTAAWVSELAREGEHRHWATATAAPCTALFKPVRLDEPVELGQPTDTADARSLWWRHERLHRLVAGAPADRLALYADERRALERAWIEDAPTSQRAFELADRRLAAWLEAQEGLEVEDQRPWPIRRYWAKRDRWAGLA